jgi:hypothetical protein
MIYPDNLINRFRNKYGLTKGNKIMKYELDKDTKDMSRIIIKIRLGTYLRVSKMIRLKLIDESFNKKCFICEEYGDDNINHWALECSGTTEIRNIYLDESKRIFIALDPDNYHISLISYILKGNKKIKCDKNMLSKYDKKINKFITELDKIRITKFKKIQSEKLNNNTSQNFTNEFPIVVRSRDIINNLDNQYFDREPLPN